MNKTNIGGASLAETMHGYRQDFPILQQQIAGKPLIYLDNAATTQKPQAVIQAISDFYTYDCANVHRGIHALSERATEAFEVVRGKVQSFINAKERSEIIFTAGTTAAINLVAQTFGRMAIGAGDQVLVSALEHHSNIVPWQVLCEEVGARLVVVPMTVTGELNFKEYVRLLNRKTKLVALTHASNALGTINPIKQMIEVAHQNNTTVLIDGAQAIAHFPVDVRALDCDFYAFSGHKLFGPTGIGVLYGKAVLLDAMPPYQTGGNMISSVTFERTRYKDSPDKFEAGTPHIAGVMGLGAALDYVNAIGLNNIACYEQALLAYATEQLLTVPGLQLFGTATHKTGILSFIMAGVHAHDVGTILNHAGVAVRSGHHCAMPITAYYGVPAFTRASLAFYNTTAEIDALVAALHQVREVFLP